MKNFSKLKPHPFTLSCLELMICQPLCESLVMVWCANRLLTSRPGVTDMECDEFWGVRNLRRVLSSDYMCCNASWACSVYTSSFPAHEPKSNCALLCELRCLSREKKLNLRGQREDRGHGFNRCVRLRWFPCICCLCSSVRVLHLTAMYYMTHLPKSVRFF